MTVAWAQLRALAVARACSPSWSFPFGVRPPLASGTCVRSRRDFSSLSLSALPFRYRYRELRVENFGRWRSGNRPLLPGRLSADAASSSSAARHPRIRVVSLQGKPRPRDNGPANRLLRCNQRALSSLWRRMFVVLGGIPLAAPLISFRWCVRVVIKICRKSNQGGRRPNISRYAPSTFPRIFQRSDYDYRYVYVITDEFEILFVSGRIAFAHVLAR